MVAARVGGALHTFDDGREHRVGDVGDEHPERERPSEPQSASQRRGPISKTCGGGDDALARLRQQTELGPAVENARDR